MSTTIKGLAFHGPGNVTIDEVPMPEILEPGDAIVRIDKTAICGTDLHPYHGRMDIEDGAVLGHEFMGTVVAVGDQVLYCEEGDRVVGSFLVNCGKCFYCRRGQQMKCVAAMVFGLGMTFGDLQGAQAEYVRVPQADLVLRKVPDDVDDEQALFVGDILTTGYEAIRKAGMVPGDVVAVIGAGPVGLCAMMSAVALGASKVVAIDMVPERLALAESLGAIGANPAEQDVDDIVLDLTEWRGADVVVDAVGHESAFKATFPLVRPGGAVSVPGAYLEDTIDFPIGEFWLKNVSLYGGIANIPAHMDETLALVREGKLDPTAIISHRLSLDDAVKGYELFDSKEAMKVVLDPHA